eukprot:456980_1
MRAWTNWIWTSTITACCVSFLMFYACQSSYDSISSKDKLPATSEANAAGYDDENDIIVIFGGYDWPQQFIQFKNNEFIFHDSSYLPSAQDISGDGQNYFQLNDTLWMLNQQGTHLITASTHPPYDVTIPSVTIPILVDNNGCLAMTHHHIFIVGGGTTKNCESHDSVQIYDMINGKWLSGVPSLPTTRMSMACYAVDGTLYAIGGIGDNCNQYYDSILTLNISDAALADISSQQWQVAPSTLNTPSEGSCIVKHRNDLIVIGGKDIDSNRLKDVNVINTLTGECFLAGTLSIGASAPACIIHRSTNTLYIFGGEDATDSWQFINLPTVDPTADPTTDPTNSPTQFPSSNPTESPTQNPTQNPSFTPSSQPSFDPSFAPSLQPSSNPSLPPTNSPTAPTIKLNANGATLSPTPRRDTTSSPTTVTMVVDTAEGTRGNMKSEFVMDELATILVVVCGSLCLIIVVASTIIYGEFKKAKKEQVEQGKNILDSAADDRKQKIAGASSLVMGNKEDSIEKLYVNTQAMDTVGNGTITGKGATTKGNGTTTTRNDEDSIEKLYINKKVVQTGTTTTGTGDKNQVEMSHTVEGENVIVMRITVEGADVHRNEVTSDALYKQCTDCGKHAFGTIYEEDGLFYCNQCWKRYDHKEQTT